MIDELVLEQLLGELAEEIAVPADGAARVVHELNASGRAPRIVVPRRSRLAMIAAAAVVVVGLGVVVNNATKSSTAKVSSGTVDTPALSQGVNHGSKSKSTHLAPPYQAPGANGNAGLKGAQGATGSQGLVGQDGGQGGAPGNPGPQGVQGDIGFIGPQGPSGAQGASPTGPTGAAGVSPPGGSNTTPSAAAKFGAVDGAKIIKNGSLDLQVPKGTLQSDVIRMTHITVGVGGYVTRSQSNFDPASATAEMTLRVPVGSFETAIKQLESMPGVKVLNDSETGVDVSAQYFNVQAKMQADTGERDSLLVLLSHTSSLGDILALRDRITNIQATIDQSQGQLNVLGDRSTYSSISVFASEKPPKAAKAAAAHHVVPPTGLAKSWQDARQGFANAVEWFISRSGGALIIFLAGLLLLFALRYLYPVMRRALL